jgi:DNA repair protein RadA/Sms
MAKTRTSYLCRDCGGVQAKWIGRCPDCAAWDTLEAFTESPAASTPAVGMVAGIAISGAGPGDGGTGVLTKAVPLVEIDQLEVPRIPTGIEEFDRVLGGGVVPGSVALLGGEPGIGKSTLLMQAAARVVSAGRTVLYVSSEESPQQIRLRGDRLLGAAVADLGNLFLCTETNLVRIVEEIRRVKPDLVLLDSIQMVYRGDLDAPPGSTTQLRRCCHDLVQLAKIAGAAVVVVGHVTKEGSLAGPKLLEHVVDAVLAFEGDREHGHRVLRATKNRFGSTQEIGLFEMGGTGLQQLDEGGIAIDTSGPGLPGSVLTATMAGTRCLPVEIQALTSTGFLGSAKRRGTGIDANRLAMLIAVLEKHGGQRLADQDIFAAVAGGIRVTEPAADLALALAIAGAHHGRALRPGTVVLGEVGLTGEIRSVRGIDQRLRELARRGAVAAVIPRSQADLATGLGLEIHAIAGIGAGLSTLE